MVLSVLLVLVMAPALPALATTSVPWTVRFTGVIDAVPATSGGAWTIAGNTVDVNSATRVLAPYLTPAAGMWADVEATPEVTSTFYLASMIVVNQPDVVLRGPLQQTPSSGKTGWWIVAAQPISVTASTRVDGHFGSIGTPKEGSWVEVTAREHNGALVALSIRNSQPAPAVWLWGAIESESDASLAPSVWTVSTIPISITASTEISGTPGIGLIASTTAALNSNQTALMAEDIQVQWLQKTQPVTVTFTGTVTSLPPMPPFGPRPIFPRHKFPAQGQLLGVWLVNGQKVMVTPKTTIDQTKGVVTVGADVQVTGTKGANGVIQATQITVLSAATPVQFDGKIESLPANRGRLGIWSIGAYSVTVTSSTRIDDPYFVRVGAQAFGEGYQVQSVITATDITVLPTWFLP
jgi:hypothetical protein